MNHFCCCSSCKPRYKRVVDHIYPRMPPYDVPVSGNMQKLTFYSIFHPEKLNRIGIYLVQRLSRDLGRQKVADVKFVFPLLSFGCSVPNKSSGML
ncbi:unnamed protein product [Meloidogyne enterolobii]|uniref:Uncharacterized protein n=1 Tax=Meloidogyne enterolobii TaxID=390850 RepID=A0ACB1B406_MELEN